MSESVSFQWVLKEAAALSIQNVTPTCVVGGSVRDALSHGRLGDADLDLMVEGNGIAFAHLLAEIIGGRVATHEAFITAKIRAPFHETPAQVSSCANREVGKIFLTEVDVATARREEYRKGGALPLVQPATLREDLSRRDFSINALAIPVSYYLQYCEGEISNDTLRGVVIDPCCGLPDLDAGVIRILHPASFIEDPTRMFRCIRYAVRLGATVEDETMSELRRAVDLNALATISLKRIWNEVVSMAGEEDGARMIQRSAELGLLRGSPLSEPSMQDALIEAIPKIHKVGGESPLVDKELIGMVLAAVVMKSGGGRVLKDLQLPRSQQKEILAALDTDMLAHEQPTDRITILRSIVWE